MSAEEEELIELKARIRALADHWVQSAEEHRKEAREIIRMTAEDYEAIDSLEGRAEGIDQCAREITQVLLGEELS